MAIEAQPLQVGHALIVQGTVRVESTNGVSRAIEPNSQIFLDDQISTGSSGAVSIVLSNDNGIQLDLGRMSQLVIDEDVTGSTLPDLGDVALEAGLAADLLHNWESLEPIATLETLIPETGESDVEGTTSADNIPGLEESSSTLASSGSSDDGAGTIDDELDITNFIPPPEDAS